MNAAQLDLETWRVDGHSVAIEYSRAVLEEVRLAAVDGFTRMGHGGIEIGGIFFGERNGKIVRILAHRPVPCEYALGPSFTLSEKDQQGLREILLSAETDAELSGMQAVGWYHSHTRSQILLSEKDLQLFDTHFPEQWQIALVLRPHILDPCRAGFFFREHDGEVRCTASYREFVVHPLAEPAPARSVEQESPQVVPLTLASGDDALPLTAPGDRQDPDACVDAFVVPLPGLTADYLPQEPVPRRVRTYHEIQKRNWTWIAAAAAAAFVAGAILVMSGGFASRQLSLRAFDMGGQLRIDWNRNADAVRHAQEGILEIEDGTSKLRSWLDKYQLGAGSVTYARTSGNVLVRLQITHSDQSVTAEVTRFLGPPVEVATVRGGLAERDRLSAEVPVITAPVPPVPEQHAPLAATSERSLQHKAEARPERSTVPGPPAASNSGPARSDPPRLAPLPEKVVPQPEMLPPVPAMTASVTPPALPPITAGLPAPLPSLPQPKPGYQGPASGKLIWTGKLARQGTIEIVGTHASLGHVTGVLPGVPVRVRVFPAVLRPEGFRVFTSDRILPNTGPEAPGAQNGWNRTEYVWNPKQADNVRIVERPGPQNSWQRLVVRAERGEYSVLILHWQVLDKEKGE